MPEARNQNRRVYGNSSKSYSNRPASYIDRALTPEQREQRQRDTEKAYQAWANARRERLAKNTRTHEIFRNTRPM